MHLSSYQISRYQLAQLAPAELLRLDEHLSTCEVCQQQMRARCNTAAAVRTLATNLATTSDAPHLMPAQFAAYVNNRLDAVERELVVSHLEFCAGCTAQAQFVRQAQTTDAPRSFVLAGLDFFRERLAFVWTMPVAAVIVLLGVALADWLYFQPTPRTPPVTPSEVASPSPLPLPAPPRHSASPAAPPQPHKESGQ